MLRALLGQQRLLRAQPVHLRAVLLLVAALGAVQALHPQRVRHGGGRAQRPPPGPLHVGRPVRAALLCRGRADAHRDGGPRRLLPALARVRLALRRRLHLGEPVRGVRHHQVPQRVHQGRVRRHHALQHVARTVRRAGARHRLPRLRQPQVLQALHEAAVGGGREGSVAGQHVRRGTWGSLSCTPRACPAPRSPAHLSSSSTCRPASSTICGFRQTGQSNVLAWPPCAGPRRGDTAGGVADGCGCELGDSGTRVVPLDSGFCRKCGGGCRVGRVWGSGSWHTHTLELKPAWGARRGAGPVARLADVDLLLHLAALGRLGLLPRDHLVGAVGHDAAPAEAVGAREDHGVVEDAQAHGARELVEDAQLLQLPVGQGVPGEHLGLGRELGEDGAREEVLLRQDADGVHRLHAGTERLLHEPAGAAGRPSRAARNGAPPAASHSGGISRFPRTRRAGARQAGAGCLIIFRPSMSAANARLLRFFRALTTAM